MLIKLFAVIPPRIQGVPPGLRALEEIELEAVPAMGDTVDRGERVFRVIGRDWHPTGFPDGSEARVALALQQVSGPPLIDIAEGQIILPPGGVI